MNNFPVKNHLHFANLQGEIGWLQTAGQHLCNWYEPRLIGTDQDRFVVGAPRGERADFPLTTALAGLFLAGLLLVVVCFGLD